MNNKQKQVQIPNDLFFSALEVCYIVLDDTERSYLDETKRKIVEKFEKGLNEKLDKMVMHDLYSKSKDASLTEEDRKKAREKEKSPIK